MPYRLSTSQRLSGSIQDIWEFWATIDAFAALQPPENRFEVTDNPDAVNELTAGLEVGYKLRIAPILWSKGRQVFSEVDAPTRFVDEQVQGTWKSFRHQHLLREIDGGVEIQNIVDYELQLEPLMRPLHRLIIVPGMMKIARFDRQVFADRFGEIGDGDWRAEIARV